MELNVIAEDERYPTLCIKLDENIEKSLDVVISVENSVYCFKLNQEKALMEPRCACWARSSGECMCETGRHVFKGGD